MTDNETSVFQQNGFKQCLYHIKNARGLGFYRCQDKENHEPNKHILPNSTINNIVETEGDWYSTFEIAMQNWRAINK